MLYNSDGVVLVMFSKHVACMESNGPEVVANLEALRIFVSSFQAKFVVEADYVNPIF